MTKGLLSPEGFFNPCFVLCDIRSAVNRPGPFGLECLGYGVGYLGYGLSGWGIWGLGHGLGERVVMINDQIN